MPKIKTIKGKRLCNGKEIKDVTTVIAVGKLAIFFQIDKDIWWKPRIIKSKEKDGIALGWLFLQIGWLNSAYDAILPDRPIPVNCAWLPNGVLSESRMSWQRI